VPFRLHLLPNARRWFTLNCPLRRIIPRASVALNAATLVPLVTAATNDRAKLSENFPALQLDQREKLPVSVQSLLAYIDSETALSAFRGGQYRFVGGGGDVQPYMLVHFLVDRAAVTSAEVAVSDLERYLQAPEIPCVQRILVCGVGASAPFEIEPGTTFIPWGQIKDADEILEQEAARVRAGALFSYPSGVIDREIVLPKILVDPGREPPSVNDWSNTDTSTLALALQLVCPDAVALPANWIRFPDWCVIWQRGMRYLWVNLERTGTHQMTETDITELRSLLTRIRALGQKDYDTLRLATSRLVLAQSHMQPVERAIDLRIAYEMTFFMGDTGDPRYQGELRFRLAMHAAKLLGQAKTADERKQIFKVGRDLYDMCSGAIHSGRISSDFDGERGQRLLSEGATMVRLALKEMLMNGKPSWPDVLMA